MTNIAVSVIGFLLAVLGGAVAIGAGFFPQSMAAWTPALAAMGRNTAVCFLLAGMALLWRGSGNVRFFIGIAIAAYGATVLWQAQAGWYPAMDALHYLFNPAPGQTSLPWPGRMATLTACGFVVTGAALAALQHVRRPHVGVCLQTVLGATLLYALFAATTRLLEHSLFYPGLLSDRGTLIATTPVGVFGIALFCGGLLLQSCQGNWCRPFWLQREDRQVFALSVVLAALMVLVAGTAVAALYTQNHLASLKDTLRVTHRTNVLLFRNTLDNALQQSTAIIMRSRLDGLLDGDAGEAALRAEARAMMQENIEGGFVAISLFDRQGMLKAAIRDAGAVAAELRVPLGLPVPSWLLWRGGWLVETHIPVFRHGEYVGEAVVEKPIDELQRQFDYAQQLGQTGEVLACTRDDNRIACFPSRLVRDVHREEMHYRDALIPMGRALVGEQGVDIGLDYRGMAVVAAFGMVPGTAIGLVQKIDVDDVFAAVRNKMAAAFALLLAVSLGGALLLARVVRPIVFALVATRRQLAAVLDNVPLVILTTDARGVIESANPAAEKVFGAPRHMLLGRPVDGLFPGIGGDDLPTGETLVLTGLRLDGTGFPAEVGFGALCLDGQRHHICVARDLSAIQRIEAVLRESEERLRGIATHIPGMVFQCVRDGDGALRFTYVSKGVERLFGMDAAQVQGDADGFLAHLASGDTACLHAAMEESARTLAQWDWEGRLRASASEELWVSLRATPRRADNGATVWDGVIFNITASKRNEDNLARLSALLRSLSAHMEAAREEERKRIAREVHDELGQTLTGLRINVSLLRTDLAQAPDAVRARLNTMMELVDRTIRASRHVISSLRPAALDLGLAAALEWLATEFSAHAGIRCTLRIPDDDIVLDEHRSITLFRIVQEALTNVARHAQATLVEVELSQQEGRILLEIRDDGRGFDLARTDGGKSFGLVGMRERVLSLHGGFELHSAPGGGTCLRIDIPADGTPPLSLHAAAVSMQIWEFSDRLHRERT